MAIVVAGVGLALLLASVAFVVVGQGASGSTAATAEPSTYGVVIPMALAGLRLMPRSSRNTHSGGVTPRSSQARM